MIDGVTTPWRRRLTASALALAMVLSACSTLSDRGQAASDDRATESTLQSGAPQTATTAAPTTALPTTAPPTSEPTSLPDTTELPDNTPVVIDGGAWQITEAEIAALHDFVEEVHELEFTEPVGVETLEDIGRDVAIGFEPIEEPEWFAMRALRLVPDDVSRDDANQVRLDRIRGVCCDEADDGSLFVAVEIQSSEEATSLIIVHELVHALHRQTIDEFGGIESSERPIPWAAATEGVPQYVAFAYLQSLPTPQQEAVLAETPIITDELELQTGPGPADFLNFVYGTGPLFTEAVVAELGPGGLTDLIRFPPRSNEHVLFPDAYLTANQPVAVEAPFLAPDVEVLHEGRLGVALLSFALGFEPGDDMSVLAPWAGDRYASYRLDNQMCIEANIEMDSSLDAVALAQALQGALGGDVPSRSSTTVERSTVNLISCGNDEPS